MKIFAGNILAINAILDKEDTPTKAEHNEIIKAMDNILSAAQDLDQGKENTSQWKIDHNIGEFRASVERAKLLASHTPPSYFLAGRLSGHCNACHALKAK
jgi:hypothetical protein